MSMLTDRRIAPVIAGLAVSVVVLLATALFWRGPGPDLPKPVDGNPVLTHGQSGPGMLASLHGTLALVDGCLLLGGEVVVWPPGTTWDEAQQAVLYSELVLQPGDELPGLAGGVLPITEFGRFLHPETIARARACSDDDTLTIVS